MDYDKFQHRQLRRNNKQLKLQLIILHSPFPLRIDT